MADLAFSASLTFPSLLCLPSPSVSEALLSQTLPYESEEAVSLPKTDVISPKFYGMFSLAPYGLWI